MVVLTKTIKTQLLTEIQSTSQRNVKKNCVKIIVLLTNINFIKLMRGTVGNWTKLKETS